MSIGLIGAVYIDDAPFSDHDLVRYGLPHIRTTGNPSFTLVSGVLSQEPMSGSAASAW